MEPWLIVLVNDSIGESRRWLLNISSTSHLLRRPIRSGYLYRIGATGFLKPSVLLGPPLSFIWRTSLLDEVGVLFIISFDEITSPPWSPLCVAAEAWIRVMFITRSLWASLAEQKKPLSGLMSWLRTRLNVSYVNNQSLPLKKVKQFFLVVGPQIKAN